MAKIGTDYSCPPFAPDIFCNVFGFKTKTAKEKEELWNEYQNAEKYYPSVTLNDGETINFWYLTKVQSFAGEDTAGYNHIYSNNSISARFRKGDSYGIATHYVNANPGLWIGFKRPSETNVNWVYLKPKTIDAAKLYDKGLMSDSQTQKDKKDTDKSIWEKLSENIATGLKWGAGAVTAYMVYDIITQKESKKTMAVSGFKKISTTQLLIGAGVGLWIANEMGLFGKKQTGTQQSVKPEYVTEETKREIFDSKQQKMRDGASMVTAESEDMPIEGFFNEFNF